MFGGGSDHPKHFEQHGGEVLGFAINKFCWIHLRRLPPFFDYRHRIVYSAIELIREIDEIKHPAVREALLLDELPFGIEMHHDGDLPARSGLGSSSSFVVGLLNALSTMHGNHASPRVLVERAIHIERERLSENVGSQDQVWAAHGGFNRIIFNPDHSYDVRPVIIEPARRQALQDSLMLFFTGFSRNSTDIAADQVRNIRVNVGALKDLQQLVPAALDVLSGSGSLDQIGLMLHDGWKTKKSLSSGVSTPEIDEIYEKGRRAGAKGGKLLGAGGGGFMLFYVPAERQKAVREALSGLVEVDFKIGAPGSAVVLCEPEGL